MGTASEDENVTRARSLGSHAEILDLFTKAVGAGDAGGWTPGKAFEYGIIRAFELEKVAEVTYPFQVIGRSGGLDGRPGVIEQVDGVVYLGYLGVLIESKDYNSNVDIEPIAKLRFRLERRPPGTMGAVFTRKEVTEPASYLLRNTVPKNIMLWQGEEIELALREKRMTAGMLLKYRHAVEYGLPDYNLKALP